MKNLIPNQGRRTQGIVCLAVLVAALSVPPGTRADDDDLAAAAPECSFNAQTWRSQREIWHDVSQQTERVASDAVRERRRGVQQPPSGGFVARNFIDDEIFGKMLRDKVLWTSRSGDEEFLRRVTLDLTGEIPDAATVKAFVADTSADKRDKLIEQLLASDAFVDRWTMWLGDLVQNTQTATNTTEFAQGRNA